MHRYNLSAKVVSHIMGYYKYKSIWIPFVLRNINTPNGTRKRFGQMRWSSAQERFSGCSLGEVGEW